MGYPFSYPVATIASGTSLSPAVYIGAGEIVSIDMPAGWDAASLTFQKSTDGVNFEDVHDDAGNEVTAQVTASVSITIGEGTAAGKAKREDFLGAPFLKIRSGTSAAPVNQGAERQLKVTVQKFYPVSPG